MKKLLKLSALSFACAISMSIISALPATAAPPSNCTSATYVCTTDGYAGRDPYGYWNYGVKDAAGRWHNCTSYAAFKISLYSPYNSSYAHLGNATTWATRAEALGLLVSTFPMEGDIAHWDYGHVAFVEDVVYNSSGVLLYIVTTSDNASELVANRVTTRRVYYPRNSNYPDHFISFPQNGNAGGGSSRPNYNVYSTPIGIGN